MRVKRVEVIGGEGLIYLATRVSRKVGGPEEIAEELEDVDRVRRLLGNIIRAGHLSVLEHSLVRIWLEADWSQVTEALFHHKYVEATPGDEVLVSMNPRTAVEVLSSPGNPVARLLAVEALKRMPLIAKAVGLDAEGEPSLHVEIRRVSEDPLVYAFSSSPHDDPRHGFFSFWTVMSRVASHQFVRHRRLSFTQRSGRYTKPDGFIFPRTVNEEIKELMRRHAMRSREVYDDLLARGVRKEDARYVLPAALKTALFVSGRQSDWHHFLELRTDIHAQDEIRGFALVVARVMKWKRRN